VIEHVDSPVKFLKSAYKVLKKGGYVLAYFPLTKKTDDKKHHGFMKHRTFYKTVDDFRRDVSSKSKFEEVVLIQSRTEGKDSKYSEGYYVGKKL